MLTRRECIPCISDDLLGAIRLLDLSERASVRIMDEASAYLKREDIYESSPPRHITYVHRILKRISGIDFPFYNLRMSCNKVGIKLASKISKEMGGLSNPDRFLKLVEWSISSNLLDLRTVGTGYELDVSQIEKMIRDNINKGLKIDHSKALYDIIKKGGKRVVYILDNVGEIAIDRLLIGEIVRLGNAVTASVRGGPITSDVTLEDAGAVGLGATGACIIAENSDTLGFSWDESTKEARRLLESADVLITKGQANYCVFSEHIDSLRGETFSLLTTKCRLISEHFGFKDKINVAVNLEVF